MCYCYLLGHSDRYVGVESVQSSFLTVYKKMSQYVICFVCSFIGFLDKQVQKTLMKIHRMLFIEILLITNCISFKAYLINKFNVHVIFCHMYFFSDIRVAD